MGTGRQGQTKREEVQEMFRIPFVKLVLGGAGAAVLGVGLLGGSATSAFAAANPTPAASPAAPAAKHDPSDRRLLRAAVVAAEAAVLDIKPEDLRAALKSGKTVEQLAQAKGMNKDQFADKLASTVKPALDKLVDAKQITRAQADKVLARIRAGQIPFWNGVHHKQAA
jgi:hypothetical protein